MAEVVNLRRVRKGKARAGKEAIAAEARARFGRPVRERKQTATLEKKRERSLDLHHIADSEET